MKKVAVIGGGPAGYTAAAKLAASGFEVFLFEEKKVGGTCLNRGCVPTKHLLAYAKTAAKAKEIGMDVSGASVEAAVEYARQGAEFFSSQVEKLLKRHKVKVIYSKAKLRRGRRVVFSEGEQVFDYVVIATGSKPFVPEIFKEIPYLTGEDYEMFKDFKKVAVIGGGAQGIEFSSFFNLLGAEVYLIEVFDRLLMQLPEKYSKLYEARLKRTGINIVTGNSVEQAESNGAKLSLKLSGGQQIEELDVVILTAGRIPNTESVEIPEIKDDHGYLKVNEYFETEEEGVFAIGDVIKTPALAYTAYAEAEAVASTIAGKPAKVDYSNLPYAVFGKPEIAWAGRLEGTEHRVQAGVSARAYAELERDGLCVVFKKEDKVNGMLIIGVEAPELIHFFEFIQKTGDLRKLFFVHPSFSEVVGEALFLAEGSPRHA